jgi:hydrogenase expression/formation protein HypC
VIVHVGFAISRIDADEAARTFQLLEEMGQLAELEDSDAEPEVRSPTPTDGVKEDG